MLVNCFLTGLLQADVLGLKKQICINQFLISDESYFHCTFKHANECKLISNFSELS